MREHKTILGDILLTFWHYNNADQLTSMIYPSGERVNYSYLPQGLLISVGGYQTGSVVDSQNRIVDVNFANGMTTNTAHHGYQDWHRAVDNELGDFLIENSPTVPQFIDKLVKEYAPLVDRFPTVLDILQKYR